MRLSANELRQFLGVLQRIDEGSAEPRFPGHVGRFLRQYSAGRRRVLDAVGIPPRADGALSGDSMGSVSVTPLAAVEVNVLDDPLLGEVASVLVASEELGAIMNLVLWTRGKRASASFNALRQGAGLVTFDGDFRWTPPSRLTPGTARVRASDEKRQWDSFRFLRVVAEDISRPPHALEYVVDFGWGRPGLKHFRAAAAVRTERAWVLASPSGRHAPLSAFTGHEGNLPPTEAALVLLYREPWSSSWTLLEHVPASGAEVLDHCVEWLDFQAELGREPLDTSATKRARSAVRSLGLDVDRLERADLTRRLDPAACAVIRELRRP